jgi:N-acylneuraminate cytidylyltransferase
MYTEGSWDFVFTAFMMDPSPLRGFEIDIETSGVRMLFPEYWDFRSQDLPPTYLDASLLYWGNERSWKSKEPIFGPNSRFLEIPKNRAVDINNLEDWEKAELLYSTQNLQVRENN